MHLWQERRPALGSWYDDPQGVAAASAGAVDGGGGVWCIAYRHTFLLCCQCSQNVAKM
jgi:hypothetical protein